MTDTSTPPTPPEPPPTSPTSSPSQSDADAAPAPPVMSYATPMPSNPPAVLSLVFGLLFFIPLAVPGVAAVLLGRRGVRAAEADGAGRAGLARAGIALGVLNLALSLAFFAWVPFGFAQARRQAQTVGCASNLRQLGMAAMMYSAGNRGFLPPTIDHLVTMIPGPGGAQVLTCPACGTNPAKPPVTTTATNRSHYHYVPPAGSLARVKTPARVVLAYEPPAHHDNRGMNILFCDGHVECIVGGAMPKVAAELAAGQNPPPSLP